MKQSMDPDLPLSVTHEVRDRCLCFRSQKTARLLGRRFDTAFRPLGITHGQFSLMIALNRPVPPRLGDLAPGFGMDRSTLTAALKPLERDGMVTVTPDPEDRRARRLHLTDKGRALLKRAVPVWRETHDAIDDAIGDWTESLRAALDRLD